MRDEKTSRGAGRLWVLAPCLAFLAGCHWIFAYEEGKRDPSGRRDARADLAPSRDDAVVDARPVDRGVGATDGSLSRPDAYCVWECVQDDPAGCTVSCG